MSKEFFSKEQQQAIVAAIKEAELNTSGEIQIHIERKCKGAVLDRAAQVFGILKLHQTKLRNGVLFYLATDDHQFAILGDVGINQKVPENFWVNIKELMEAQFKKGQFAEGLVEGVKTAGLQLKAHFPYKEGDKNELPDQISFGSN